MKKLILALFAALALSQAADAQEYDHFPFGSPGGQWHPMRRARSDLPAAVGPSTWQWVWTGSKWVWAEVSLYATPAAKEMPKPPAAPLQRAGKTAQTAQSVGKGGRVRDFIKWILHR